MKKKYLKTSINGLSVISLVIFSLIMCISGEKAIGTKSYLLITMIISLIFGIYLYKKEIFLKWFKDRDKIISLISGYLTISLLCQLRLKFNVSFISNYISLSIGLLKVIKYGCLVVASLAVFGGLYYLVSVFGKFMKKELKKTTKSEKRFVAISFAILLIINIVWYTLTDFSLVIDDMIYSIDSNYVASNMFARVTWALDIRHVFYSILTFPFYSVYHTLNVIFPLPSQFYPIFVSMFDVSCIILTSIMLKRMMNSDAVMYLYLCSFPCILYSVIIEKFQFCVFLLVLFIYARLQDKEEKELEDIALISSVGAITTTAFMGIWSNREKGWKKLGEWIKVGLLFIGFTAVVGRIRIILTLSVSKLDFPFLNCFYGLTEMLASCFLAPKAIIKNGIFIWQNEAIYLNVLGLVILILCVISFVMNRKNRFVQICFYWLGFSVLLFMGMKWYCYEAPLFNMYFSWAIVSLVYLLFDRIIKNRKWKGKLVIGFTIFMLTINVIQMIDIFKFFYVM